MPKKRKKQRRGERRPPPGRRPPGGGGAGRAKEPRDEEPDLVHDVRGTLEESHPLGLLAYASSLLCAVAPDRQDPFARVGDEPLPGPDLSELLASFLGVPIPETTALLTVLAELVPDELLSQRIRRELRHRDHPLPGWLAGLAPLRVVGALEMSHVLGDGDNVAIDVRTGTGAPLTVMAYIDHNLGTLVKDAFVLDQTTETVTASFLEAAGGDPDLRVRELDLADARVRVDEAIASWAVSYPPLETDTWPAARPLIEWVLGHMPDGGDGYGRPEWSDDDLAVLAGRFFASPFARSAEDPDRQVLDSLLWFGRDYGPGDPLRWSPVAVEILLTDWLPRKVLADEVFLSRAPEVLRGLIRFSHTERGIRQALTRETLEAVDQYEGEFREAIRSPASRGPAGMLAVLGLGDGPSGLGSSDGLSYRDLLLDSLREEVGGADALEKLDTERLPDEPLELGAVPEDVRGRVVEVAGLADACCAALLDVEYRTACRRLLADVAAADGEIFRRRGRSDTAAAAIVWIAARANDRLTGAGGLTAKALGEWFGVSNASQRASTLLKALDAPDPSPYSLRLGSPRYLVAARRRAIIQARERYEALEG